MTTTTAHRATPASTTWPCRTRAALFVAGLVTLLAGCASGSHDPAAHAGHATHAAALDTRLPVRFPEPLRSHTLANMRDHLLALAEIQGHLGRGAFDQAAAVAEQRLGLSSLRLHGAHEVAGFMPAGMQAAGTAMHRSASRFAIVAQEASATGDHQPPLAALAELTQACVACHAAYRLE
jgi:hypothetical protein